MFERAKPVRPCAEMPAAVDANPPSSTYWATDATVSLARERWPVMRQPLRRVFARDGPGADCAARIAREAGAVPGRAAGLVPLAASRGRCRLPSPSTTFKLTTGEQ